jgi:UPF0042 nucleotide-binding protein
VRIVIVTGLSGAGKSTALRALEDIGFFCVDNAPLPLLAELAAELAQAGTEDLAIGIDTRQHALLPGYGRCVIRLREGGHSVEVLFLEAPDDLLVRRFSETRRRHPLAGDDLRAGIRRDRVLLEELRRDATDALLDTAHLNVHQLKGIIQERYGRREGALSITLLSFGFKHGLPAEADVVMDCRFLPNPYFVEELSGKDGRDPAVGKFVLDHEEGHDLLDHLERLTRYALPQFEREHKLYVTIAIGCTGGRHRSVAVVEALGRRLSGDWDVVVRHRDLLEG